MVKNLPAMWENQPGSIPGSGRFPGEGSGKPLQYSCLENSMDRGDWVGYNPWGHKRVRHDLVTKTRTTHYSENKELSPF